MFTMTINDLLSSIDSEIVRLEQARDLLTGTRIRNAKATTRPAKVKRILSAEARKRIADAQRRRWAAQKRKAKAA
jgi:hypothetical protein